MACGVDLFSFAKRGHARIHVLGICGCVLYYHITSRHTPAPLFRPWTCQTDYVRLYERYSGGDFNEVGAISIQILSDRSTEL